MRALLLVFLVGCSRPPATKGTIVFVEARWSAPSEDALRQLRAVLATDPNAPALVVIDIDDEPKVASWRTVAPFPIGGSGETFWVKDDGVVAATAFTIRSSDRALVLRNNALLR